MLYDNDDADNSWDDDDVEKFEDDKGVVELLMPVVVRLYCWVGSEVNKRYERPILYADRLFNLMLIVLLVYNNLLQAKTPPVIATSASFVAV